MNNFVSTVVCNSCGEVVQFNGSGCTCEKCGALITVQTTIDTPQKSSESKIQKQVLKG